ncbi:MAG TPA: NAD-dependent epimerase/dehydratase family protein [Candidatus Polarisedimenticolaceae bacterium]|nr:NAD-dependent epimerase/dehydratase family protein [Candidatus Polarisedimenticolaceae bacterium]
MNRNRRAFVKTAAAAGAGAALAAALPRLAEAKRAARASSPKKILILGGTAFLGPQVVDAARARGHVLTLFNRGKTNPGLFPDVEKLRGDRDGDLKSLEGRSWDAVVDTSGFVPRLVTMSASLLAPNVKQYVFISTISVFAEGIKPQTAENGPLATMPDETSEDIGKYYGALKAACERAAESAMPGRAWNVRPGLIVGPGDKTDRFTYWPVRLAKGGEVLAPGDGTDPVQFVDVRDLGAWIVLGIERGLVGVYNAVGPETKLTMKGMLDGIKAGVGGDARLTWVPASFLEKKEVQPWTDLPVWVPSNDGQEGFTQIDCRKAIAAGLTFRPVAATAKDTLAWFRTLSQDRRGTLGKAISSDKEKELLAAWHAEERVKISGTKG